MSKSETASNAVDPNVLAILRQEFRGMPGALALWDLVRACRNPDFVIRNNDSKTYLLDKNLVEKFGKKGRAVIPQVVRSTVTSTVVGEGLNLRFRIPATR